MRLPRTRRRHDAENMVPLINVVFLLLIFVMLIGEITRPDPFGISPPGSTGEDADRNDKSTVFLSREGQIAADGKEMTRDRLAAYMQARVRDGGLKTIRLKVDQDADATGMIGIMTLMKRAGVETTRLVTTRSGP